MRKVWIVAVLLVACAGEGTEPAASPSPEGHTLTGELTASECGGGYDIKFASVEVRDEENTVIGSSTTGDNLKTYPGLCTVEFEVTGLPDAEFYQLKIGTHGGPSYALHEMEAADWHLSLEL